jgi:hypothetical protein
MPVILATWEAEIRRITVRGQLGQKVRDPLLNGKKLGMVVHACHPRDGRKLKIENCGPGWPGPE